MNEKQKKYSYKDTCIECGKEFETNLITRKYCCRDCGKIAALRNGREDYNKKMESFKKWRDKQ